MEQLAFLRAGYLQMSLQDLTPAFNGAFALEVTAAQIRGALRNHRITSGRTGRFGKGSVSWNLGVKGCMVKNRTSFQKGSTPPNRKPVGSERICSKQGFVLIKVAEPDPYTGFPTRYRHKHVHVWEQLHGPVPRGHVLPSWTAIK